MKVIISYIMLLSVITLFTLFLDAVSGLFVLIIFISAIVISTALHIYAVKAFDCDISVNANLLEKGDKIEMQVRTPKAAFFLPSVFEIKFKLSYHLNCREEIYAITLGRQEKAGVFLVDANFWGKANIEIAQIKANDILGIFAALPNFAKLKSTGRICKKNVFTVKIFPGISELSHKAELIRTLEDASIHDDNDQSREIPFAFTGFPGYEHRDYVPGDPLKSINWKLSAKRDKLFVRKPEAYAGGDMALFLDSRCAPQSEEFIRGRIAEQSALESMLALAQTLSKQEILCRVYVLFDGEWGVTSVQGADDIENLRFALTEYSYREDGERLPSVSEENASGFVIFTANPDEDLYSQTEALRHKGNNPEIVSPIQGICSDWLIQENDSEISFVRS
ncbi:MAG: DUF58 domain-containing protein [Oscillospiraceae bacterium]|nr:DUF58 domain-containing protein [Oscillospiraceae bacterium]